LPAINKLEEKVKEFKQIAGAKLTVILAEKPCNYLLIAFLMFIYY